jgi:RNA polymerase sigma factor (sigma-70 family)
MKRKDGGTTSPLLLKQVADWADHPAWCDFFRNYDSLIHLWCQGYGLDYGTLEDLCQQIWIELADRMRTYQYDPGRTFRGWLRQFCHSRAVDVLRKRRKELDRFLSDQPADVRLLGVDAISGEEREEPE